MNQAFEVVRVATKSEWMCKSATNIGRRKNWMECGAECQRRFVTESNFAFGSKNQECVCSQGKMCAAHQYNADLDPYKFINVDNAFSGIFLSLALFHYCLFVSTRCKKRGSS